MRYQFLSGVLASCPSLPFSVIGGSATVVDASVDDGEFDGTSSACVIASDPPSTSVVVEGVAVEGALVDGYVEPGLAGSLGCEDSCELLAFSPCDPVFPVFKLSFLKIAVPMSMPLLLYAFTR